MTSGSAFIAILLFWICGLIIAFYMLFPSIQASLTIVQSIDLNESSNLINDTEIANNPVEYSPLGVFNILSN